MNYNLINYQEFWFSPGFKRQFEDKWLKLFDKLIYSSHFSIDQLRINEFFNDLFSKVKFPFSGKGIG